jgi:DinB family protein
MLAPEQLRALDYLRRKGTEAPAAELRQSLGAAFRKAEALFDAVPPAARAVRPARDVWSVQEVVDHLIESHRPAVAQLAELLAGRSVTEPIPASLQSSDPLAVPWDDLVRGLKSVHAGFERLLDEAGEAPLSARARVAMVAQVAQPDGSTRPVTWHEDLDWKAFVQGVRGHTLQHVAQAQRILDGLRSSLPG